MPKKVKEKSAVEVRRITRPGRHTVGGVNGLVLDVKDSGSKSWILRVMVGGVRRYIGLGPFPDVTLSQAREKARLKKDLIEQGIDPVQERADRRKALMEAQGRSVTFADIVNICHEKKQTEFRNAKHSHDWISSVKRYAVPVIGKVPLKDIDLHHILKVLEPIWTTKTETATRLRQRLEYILNWATVSGYRSGDNPARWKGHLDAVLPAPTKIKKVTHFKALPWQEVGKFMKELRKRKGISARCLEFVILTACRSGEARLSEWEEFDLESALWTIPGTRTKTNKEHRVPLSDATLALLQSLPRFEGSQYVFTSTKGGPLSDMSLSMLCRKMKVDVVPHGFRSTFRDWAAESTNYPREVVEMALAHTIDNKVEAAYRRGDLFAKRTRLMQDWANYCNKEKPAEKVTPIRQMEAVQ